MQITARQIAQIVNGSIIGDESTIVSGPSKIEEGVKGTITFLANPKYKEYLQSTQASVVLISNDFVPDSPVNPTLIIVENVYQSLAVLMEKFNSGVSIASGIAATAVIASSAEIGNGTSIDPGVKIYHNCVIGDRCVIHANSVIGSDGFGFARDESGNYKKIPQTGNVVLENDVEIGSNTVIDRASMGSTIIKSGAKLDNLIQIAHNVSVGNNTAIAAQSGVAGSVNIGEHCIIGGQVGIAGHLSIADGTMIQAQSGISSTVKGPNAKLYGSPAIDYQNYLKSYAYFRKFPEIVQQLRSLQSAIDKINQEKP